MPRRLTPTEIEDLESEAADAYRARGPEVAAQYVPRLCEAIDQLLDRVDELEDLCTEGGLDPWAT